MHANKTKRKLQAGHPVLGAMLKIAEPALVELCGYAGFDFVFIDGEHGPIGIESLVQMVRAAEIHDLTAVVRVPRNAPDVICQVLDIGAQGIVVPGVTTREDAEQAVRSAKYSPIGKRGVGSGRARGYGQLMPMKEYATRANMETMVVALLEDIEVIKHVHAILEVEGIDVFIVGLSDLSQSMDLVGQGDHPDVQEARRTIVDHVLGAGRVMGTVIQDVEDAKKSLNRGFLWLHVSLSEVIARTARQLVESIGSSI